MMNNIKSVRVRKRGRERDKKSKKKSKIGRKREIFRALSFYSVQMMIFFLSIFLFFSRIYAGSGTKESHEPVETKEGDVVTCGFDVALVKNWNGVIPAPNQNIAIYWKVNGEEVSERDKERLGRVRRREIERVTNLEIVKKARQRNRQTE